MNFLSNHLNIISYICVSSILLLKNFEFYSSGEEGFIFRPFWDSSESLPRNNWRALIELRVEEARQADRVEEISRGTKQDWNDSCTTPDDSFA